MEKNPGSPTLKRQERDENPEEEKSLSPPMKRCEQYDEEEEDIVDIKVEQLDRPPLPPRQVIGPDEHGFKRYVDYSWVGNRKVRTVTTTRVHKIATVRVSKRVLERRKTWCKFGDAENDDREIAKIRLLRTSTSGIVKLERPPNFIPAASVPSAPRLLPTKAASAAREQVLAKGGPAVAAARAAAAAGAEARGLDVYPGDTKTESECFVVRIDQLPLESTEDNVRVLMEQFGGVKHVFIARHPRTRASLRYAFVYFFEKEDGEAAVEALSDGLEARVVGMLTC